MAMEDLEGVVGLKRFGIRSKRTLGIRTPDLRKLTQVMRPEHPLAQRLRSSGIFECRILAALVDDPD